MKKKVTISITSLVVVFLLSIVYLGLYENDFIGENKSLNKEVITIIEDEEDKKLDLASLNKTTAFEWDEVYLISPYKDVNEFFENVDTYAPEKTYNSETTEVYMLAFIKYSDKVGKNKLIEYTYIPSSYIDVEKLKDMKVMEENYHYINGDLV
ncbi:hypothetical protein GNF80_05420 [Clostridium perfringens]|nr:hypothetical protein [Clostridium perfringens]